MLLWAFDIRQKVDPATGKEMAIDTLRFTPTANSHPLRFEASFKARIPSLDSVLRDANA